MKKLYCIVLVTICFVFAMENTVQARRYYDAAMGRWLVPDPALREKEPQWLIENGYYSVSPYVYCNNNPIIFVDPGGDTITVSEKLANTEQWKEWVNSEEGKKFYEVFQAGGEWGHINVDFSLVKNVFGFEVAGKFSESFGAGLGAFKGNTALLENGKEVEEIQKGLDPVKEAYTPKNDAKYSFGVTLHVLHNSFNKGYNTITHETDHVIYMTHQIIKNLPIGNGKYQHENLRMEGAAGTHYYLLPKIKPIKK